MFGLWGSGRMLRRTDKKFRWLHDDFEVKGASPERNEVPISAKY